MDSTFRLLHYWKLTVAPEVLSFGTGQEQQQKPEQFADL
jgi:hypothetical protein